MVICLLNVLWLTEYSRITGIVMEEVTIFVVIIAVVVVSFSGWFVVGFGNPGAELVLPPSFI